MAARAVKALMLTCSALVREASHRASDTRGNFVSLERSLRENPVRENLVQTPFCWAHHDRAAYDRASHYKRAFDSKASSRSAAFTLIELVVVIAIISVLLTLFGLRTGTFNFWRDESFLRRLSETMVFLHRQAVIDGSFYRIEFDLTRRQYRVGMIIPSSGQAQATGSVTSANVGTLELELNEIVSPALGTTQLMVDPPSFPSLADPIPFPPELIVERVKNPRGEFSEDSGENPFILFSPRGFSEFAVINIRLSDGRPVTLAVNSFTGLTQIYREERDFDWTYGRAATN